ncbi:Trypsin domain containing protein [Asbolus verrucosus]|uniref:Trypsin domain containing protein n=1 Tax=Asbolus verrucosus TaxID=1661398 RepID=A0A482WCI1_ASBVE|nr:Trypsin domain containing protein [Asbolus verrucosus]
MLLILKVTSVVFFQTIFQNIFADGENVTRRFGAKIVGGRVCKVTEYPFVVSVLSNKLCGGTLITFLWVLTAGHCIVFDRIGNDGTQIRSGFDSPPRYIQIRYARQGVVYEKFNIAAMTSRPPDIRYDIGLILVDRPFIRSVTLNTVALPTPGFTQTCTVGKVLGIGNETINYGRTVEDHPLKCVDLRIVDSATCAKTFSFSTVDDTLVCTQESREGKDACYGDSGGPLLCRNNTIIGIISFGRGCALANVSATHTRVESFLDFINETLNEDYDSNGVQRNSWKCLLYAIIFSSFLIKI